MKKLLIIAIAFLLMACQPGPGKEEQARQERRDSLLNVIQADIDSLGAALEYINETQAKLDSAFSGMESESWYREKSAGLQVQREIIIQAIQARRQERAALEGGG